jgi:hypothetical protein
MRLQAMTKLIAGAAMMVALGTSGWMAAQAAAGMVLKPADLEKLFPAKVYYNGQTAPVEMRNTGGVKFADGHYVLAGLVDTSGYSTGVASKYQGYLITEVPLKIGGKFLVTDLGGGDVLTAQTATDAALSRPRPLEVTVDPAGGYRLYSGRTCVHFSR